jgi:hypothetical protein
MKIRFSILTTALIIACVLLPSAAFSWGWAVHTYIDDQFNTKWAVKNGNQLYGGLAPDLFNFRYDAPAYREYLFYQTHNNFMKVWDEAQSIPGKALALGFVSHNESWGVDFTAHRSGITFGQKGTIPGHPDEGGYVIAKAYQLKAILEQVPEYNALQLPEPLTMTVAHELVERGVDLLMKTMDPMIGAKMSAAALPPNPNFPLLMERAYAGELAYFFGISHTDAVKFIAASERQYRQMLVLYGQALLQDTDTAIYLNALQLEEAAKHVLAAYGLPPFPEGVDIKPLLQFGIYQSMLLCADDFGPEVAATAAFVGGQMEAHGISY